MARRLPSRPLPPPPRLDPGPAPGAEPLPDIADLVVRAGAALLADRRARARAHGIPLTGVRVLEILARDGGLLQRELAARVRITPTTLTPALDRLEDEGLAVRQVDAGDRRARRITITDAGRERLAAVGVAARDPIPPEPAGGHGAIVREYLLAVLTHLEQDHHHARGQGGPWGGPRSRSSIW